MAMTGVSLAPPAGIGFAACADMVAHAAREIAGLGWAPATSGNFSARMDAGHVAITVSGRDKRGIGRDGILLIDNDGNIAQGAGAPSAETALHLQIYRRYPDVHAVLHTHSRAQSVASRLFADAGRLTLDGWELQKALAGHSSHEDALVIPVFPNTQHMPDLVDRVDAWLDAGKPLHAYLIAGHGLYTWGHSMADARRHLEALEFLLECELDLWRVKSP